MPNIFKLQRRDLYQQVSNYDGNTITTFSNHLSLFLKKGSPSPTSNSGLFEVAISESDLSKFSEVIKEYDSSTTSWKNVSGPELEFVEESGTEFKKIKFKNFDNLTNNQPKTYQITITVTGNIDADLTDPSTSTTETCRIANGDSVTFYLFLARHYLLTSNDFENSSIFKKDELTAAGYSVTLNHPYVALNKDGDYVKFKAKSETDGLPPGKNFQNYFSANLYSDGTSEPTINITAPAEADVAIDPALYLMVYRKIPDLTTLTLEKFGENKSFDIRTLSGNDTAGYTASSTKSSYSGEAIEYRDLYNTGSGVVTRLFGYVTYDIQADDNILSGDGETPSEVLFSPDNTTITYRVRFYRYTQYEESPTIRDSDRVPLIISAENTFNVVVEDLEDIYWKKNNKFIKNLNGGSISSITVTDKTDGASTNISVTADDDYTFNSGLFVFKNLDDFVNKDIQFVITTTDSSTSTGETYRFTLKVYDDKIVDRILRSDGVDSFSIDLTDTQFKSYADFTIGTTITLEPPSTDVNADIINSNSLDLTLTLNDNSKPTSLTVKHEDFNIQSGSNVKEIKLIYRHTGYGPSDSFQHELVVTINVYLVMDLEVGKSTYGLLESFSKNIPDWGETKFSTTKLKKSEVTTDISTNKIATNTTIVIGNHGDYPDWLHDPSVGSINRKKGVSGVEAGTVSFKVYVFETSESSVEASSYGPSEDSSSSDRFLYFVSYTIELTEISLPEYSRIIAKKGEEQTQTLSLSGYTISTDLAGTGITTSGNETLNFTGNIIGKNSYTYDVTATTEIGSYSESKTLDIYVYGDIEVTSAKVETLCNVVSLKDKVHTGSDAPLYEDYMLHDTNVFPDGSVTTTADFPNLNTSTADYRTTQVTRTVTLDGEVYYYYLIYKYLVAETVDSGFHSEWPMDGEEGYLRMFVPLDSTLEDESTSAVNLLIEEAERRGFGILQSDIDSLKANSSLNKTGEGNVDDITVQLTKGCSGCGDTVCVSSPRNIIFTFYDPFKTLMVCTNQTFDSSLLNINKYYIRGEVENVLVESTIQDYETTNVRADLFPAEGIDEKDWLLVKNSSSGSKVGLYNVEGITSAAEYIWTTTTVQFESSNKNYSSIIYYITLAGPIKRCLTVLLGKEVKLPIPEIFGNLKSKAIQIKDDEALVWDSINDNLTDTLDISSSDLNDLAKAAAEDDDSSTGTATAPIKEYDLIIDGIETTLKYKIRILVDQKIAYAKLPPIKYRETEWSYDFVNLIAQGYKISNIYCLPEELEWVSGSHGYKTVIQLKEEQDPITCINGSNKCPHKIIVEVTEDDCKCELGNNCLEDCVLIDGNEEACCGYDTTTYFLYIDPNTIAVNIPELIELDTKLSEGELTQNLDNSGELDTLTINISNLSNDGENSINLENAVNNKGNYEVKFEGDVNVSKDNTFTYVKSQSHQLTLSAKYKDHTCNWIEFGRIIIAIEISGASQISSITNEISSDPCSQTTTNIRSLLEIPRDRLIAAGISMTDILSLQNSITEADEKDVDCDNAI